MNSMTGFGKGVYEGIDKTYTIELRSVNHRFLEVKMRLPKGMLSIEDKIEKIIKQTLGRGSVNVYINIEHLVGANKKIAIDLPLAKGYYEALKEIETEFGFKEDVSLKDLMKYQDILKLENISDEDEEWKAIKKALDSCLENVLQMRRVEGLSLKEDFKERTLVLEKLIAEIFSESEDVVASYQIKLRERISELLGGLEVNEEKIAHEVAFFADKASITEELVRLEIHLKQFKGMLEETIPVGRKLDFLIQEINREINTIGSKSNLPSISSRVIELKSEVEKIREQVQNVE